MMDVRVVGISLHSGYPNRRGARTIAYFDCELGGLRMNGCRLMQEAGGEITAWPPMLTGPQDSRRSVVISDEGLRHRIMVAARAAYHAIGGTCDSGAGQTTAER